MAGRVVAVLLAVAIAASLAACGDGGGEATTSDEKAADAELLNEAIGVEQGTIDAYRSGQPLLGPPRNAKLSLVLRVHAQEHLNSFTKAMRGLGAEVDAEPEELDLAEVKNEADFLLFAYEREANGLEYYADLVTKLETGAPRRLAAAAAASKAQHLVVLRQALGARLLEAIPEAFDGSEVPPPVPPAEKSGPEGAEKSGSAPAEKPAAPAER